MNSRPTPSSAPMRWTALLAAVALTGGGVQAANFSKSAYDSSKADIKATYKAEREHCASLGGNGKDVCIEQAKGREAVALAQLNYNYSGKAADEQKLYEVRAESRYELAKERCDDFAGQAKDVCLRQAQSDREKAVAEIKLSKKVTAAIEDADEARTQADFKLAIEKCKALGGDAKDSCVATAKARHGER
jgi:hypothetical protein